LRPRFLSLASLGLSLIAALLCVPARAEEPASAVQDCGFKFRATRPGSALALLGLPTTFMVFGESLKTPTPSPFEPAGVREMKDQWSDQQLRLREYLSFVPQRSFALFSSTATRSIWPGWGELFPGDIVGRCRVNGSGVKDPACFYVRMNFRF
jgi:hypothetical protein